METTDRAEPAAYSPLPQERAAAPQRRAPEPAWTAGAVVVAAAACGSLFWGAAPARREMPAAVPVPAGAFVAAPEGEELALPLPGAPEAQGRPVPGLGAVAAPRTEVPAAPASAGRAVSPVPELEAAASAAALSAGAGLVWARAQPSVSWRWPAGLEPLRLGRLPKAERRRLAGWFPQAPEGEQLLYDVRMQDGSSKRVYEKDLEVGNRPAAVLNAASLAQTTARQRAQAALYELLRPLGVADRAAALEAVKESCGARSVTQTGANRLTAVFSGGRTQTLDLGVLTETGFSSSIEDTRAHELKVLALASCAASVRDVSNSARPMAEVTYADGRKEVVPYDPLVFDLGGRGVKTSERKVLFDLVGAHRADKTQWMHDLDGDTGMLVFDSTRSGRSGKSGSEVFGDRTDLEGKGTPDGYVDGFHALRAMAEKAAREGVIPEETLRRGVLDAPALAALEKAYGLRMKVGGFNAPAISLARAGVAAIALSDGATRRVRDFDGRGDDLVLQPGAVFLRADGTTGSYMNVFLGAGTGNLGLRIAAR